MKIRAITVDLWGTLFVDPPLTDNRYRRQRLAGFEAVLAEAGARVPMSELDLAYEVSESVLGRLWMDNRDLSLEGHVRAILGAIDPALADRLPPDTIGELGRAYADPAVLAPPALADGARGALETLFGRGYTLCLVSNTMRTPGEAVRRILAQYGLLSCFSVLTFSDECGIRKPDPEIFRLTLRKVTAEADQAVHVGDDSMLDVKGARAAGLRVVQVSATRPPFWWARADATIPSLGGLPDVIARLDGRP